MTSLELVSVKREKKGRPVIVKQELDYDFTKNRYQNELVSIYAGKEDIPKQEHEAWQTKQTAIEALEELVKLGLIKESLEEAKARLGIKQTLPISNIKSHSKLPVIYPNAGFIIAPKESKKCKYCTSMIKLKHDKKGKSKPFNLDGSGHFCNWRAGSK